MPTPQKACPRCGRVWPLSILYCANCSHQFRTRFDAQGSVIAPPDRTAVFAPPAQPAEGRPHAGSHLFVAILLALVWPGFGQIYSGQYGKGLFLVGVGILAPIAGFVALLSACAAMGSLPQQGTASDSAGVSLLVFLALLASLGLVIFLDALCIALRVSRREIVAPWQWF